MGNTTTAEPRSFARLMAVQALYTMEMTGEETVLEPDETITAETVAFFREHAQGEIEALDLPEEGSIQVDKRLFKKLVKGCFPQRDELDTYILTFSTKTSSTETMNLLLQAILRVAVYELRSVMTPASVVITEYMHITEIFYGTNEARFIHAVLDKIARHQQDNTATAD